MGGAVLLQIETPTPATGCGVARCGLLQCLQLACVWCLSARLYDLMKRRFSFNSIMEVDRRPGQAGIVIPAWQSEVGALECL